jgi:hypothetical protein
MQFDREIAERARLLDPSGTPAWAHTSIWRRSGPANVLTAQICMGAGRAAVRSLTPFSPAFAGWLVLKRDLRGREQIFSPCHPLLRLQLWSISPPLTYQGCSCIGELARGSVEPSLPLAEGGEGRPSPGRRLRWACTRRTLCLEFSSCAWPNAPPPPMPVLTPRGHNALCAQTPVPYPRYNGQVIELIEVDLIQQEGREQGRERPGTLGP